MKILFQGDSVTDCGRCDSGGAGYEKGEMGPGYPGLIKSRLMCDRPADDLHFINRGISGSRIVDLYARWRSECINMAPDIVSILIGVNDSWHENCQNGVEVPRAIRIYNELLDWTIEKLPGVRLVLLEPFTLPGSDNAASFGDEVRERAAAVRAAAGRLGAARATLIPLQSIFDEACKRAHWSHWSADGVHPTPAGHQLIADAWLRSVAI